MNDDFIKFAADSGYKGIIIEAMGRDSCLLKCMKVLNMLEKKISPLL